MLPSSDIVGLLDRVEALVPAMQARAAELDAAAAFPVQDIAALRVAGLLHAPVPVALGGCGLGTEPAAAEAALAAFQALGRGNLALGRLAEAHVNALRLVFRYGDAAIRRSAAADAAAGHLCALWVTDPPDGALQLLPGEVLDGAKQFCSGAGHATRAVLTTADASGDVHLVYAALGDGVTATPLPGGPAGMRAATTGQVRFDHVDATVFGMPGDYLREPDFSCGAWRTSAVTVGGIAALSDALRRQLRERGRADDPHQQARVGQVLIALETARLWVAAAAARAEAVEPDEGAVTYVGLARLAVERAALDVMELTQRSLGLAALMRGNPVERICRDLATYLRQPAGDMVLTEAAAPGAARVITAGQVLAQAAAAPIVALGSVTGGCALVLAPHPDDESLGCGGLIAASCALSQPPVVVVLTDGAGSHPGSRSHPPERLRQVREAETVAAVACLGLPPDRLCFLRTLDTAAPTAGPEFAAAVAELVAIGRRHGCRSILASWRHDPHCDHEAAALIADAAAAELGIPHRAYPVWGRTLPPDTPVGATAGMRLDVARWQAAKRQAIRCHRSQWAGLITDAPAGFQMSEAFMALFDTPHEIFLEPA